MRREGHRPSVARPLRRVTLALLALVLGLVASAVPATALGPEVDDPGFPLQWNLQAIGAPTAWGLGTGAGQTIAIVDSGVDLGHQDLAGKIVGHVTCLDTGGDPAQCTAGGAKDGVDDNGHGTHVAGIAAADTDNGVGVAGVAPQASILSVKVLRQTCDSLSGCDATGTADDVAAGIEYASTHGATVINLSLGNTTQSVLGPAFSKALEDAWSRGVVSVLAAGNDYVLPSGVGMQPVIVVGALNRAGTKASYGNSIGNAQWALMAPGGEADSAGTCAHDPQGVLSTYLGNQLACLAGTSMAAPHVAGAAAVLRSMGLSPWDTIRRLLGTARKMDPSSVYGSGALDLAAAASGATASTQAATPAAPDGAADPSSSTASGATGDGAAVAPGPATAGDPSTTSAGPATTAAPPVIDLGGSHRTASPARGHGVTDDLPTGPVVVAVLLAVGVAISCAWVLLRDRAWATRTPPRR